LSFSGLDILERLSHRIDHGFDRFTGSRDGLNGSARSTSFATSVTLLASSPMLMEPTA
jgi:hypothetical protein